MIKLLALLLRGVKVGKLLTTGGAMLLSLGVYGMVFGWRYAAGFVAMILVHEMGHYVAARQLVKAWKFRADDRAHGNFWVARLETRAGYALAYIGLLLFLGIRTHDLHDLHELLSTMTAPSR